MAPRVPPMAFIVPMMAVCSATKRRHDIQEEDAAQRYGQHGQDAQQGKQPANLAQLCGERLWEAGSQHLHLMGLQQTAQRVGRRVHLRNRSDFDRDMLDTKRRQRWRSTGSVKAGRLRSAASRHVTEGTISGSGIYPWRADQSHDPQLGESLGGIHRHQIANGDRLNSDYRRTPSRSRPPRDTVHSPVQTGSAEYGGDQDRW